jgi:hypothetical protein
MKRTERNLSFAQGLMAGLDVNDPSPQHLPAADEAIRRYAGTVGIPLTVTCRRCGAGPWWTCETTNESEELNLGRIHLVRWGDAEESKAHLLAMLRAERDLSRTRGDRSWRRSVRVSPRDGDEFVAYEYDCGMCQVGEGTHCRSLSHVGQSLPLGWVHRLRAEIAEMDLE